jgi:hypothetical protein
MAVGDVGGSGRGSGKERSHRAGGSRLDSAANTEMEIEYLFYNRFSGFQS